MPVRQPAVPVRKSSMTPYMGTYPQLPPHRLPSQHAIFPVDPEVASRKRPHVTNSTESPRNPARHKKHARMDNNFNDKSETEISTTINTSKTRANIPKISPGTVGLATHTEDDVLSGRGGGTNCHPGNKFFRELINLHRHQYLKAKKNDKPHISRSIVNRIRAKNGRFLKKDDEDGLWYEIGDDLAREKTSQALRQKAPEHRKFAEEQVRMNRECYTNSMPNPNLIPMSASSMMDRRTLPGMERMDVPPPLSIPSNYDQMYQHEAQDDELMLHYLQLRRRQSALEREIAMVAEIKQMKERMQMYQQHQRRPP